LKQIFPQSDEFTQSVANSFFLEGGGEKEEERVVSVRGQSFGVRQEIPINWLRSLTGFGR